MKSHSGSQAIKQLEKRKGGYFYLELDSAIIDQFSRKKATRMICTVDKIISFRCGLNHLGDGNFFIIMSGKNLKELGKSLGDIIEYKIEEDPDQLGIEIPEVLMVLLDQDSESKAIFDKLSDGKKRSLIFSINKLKDIDRQIKITLDFLQAEGVRMKDKK